MAISFNTFVRFVFRLFRPMHIHHHQFITSLHPLHVCPVFTTVQEKEKPGRMRGVRQMKLTETCRASLVCVPQIFVFSTSFTSRSLSFFKRITLSPPISRRSIFRVCYFFSCIFNRRVVYFDSFFEPFCALLSFICCALCAITAYDDVAIVVILHPERTVCTSQHQYVCNAVTYARVSGVCSCENPLWSNSFLYTYSYRRCHISPRPHSK